MTDFTENQVSFLITKGVKEITPSTALALRPDDAYEAFKELRWGWTEGAARCPHCNHERVYEYANRGLFKCAKCGRQFTVTVKTPFHAQKLGHKSIVSALSIKVHRPSTIMEMAGLLGINYRSAWRLNKTLRLIRSNLRPISTLSAPVYWPYRKPTGHGGDMVQAVNSAIPKNIPEDVRADVAQELILGVLQGDITMEQVASEAAKYLRRFRREYEWDPQAFSWDQNVPGTDRLKWDDVLASSQQDEDHLLDYASYDD